MAALFLVKGNRLTGDTEYISRRTGVSYSVGQSAFGHHVMAPGLTAITQSRKTALKIVELVDNTG